MHAWLGFVLKFQGSSWSNIERPKQTWCVPQISEYNFISALEWCCWTVNTYQLNNNGSASRWDLGHWHTASNQGGPQMLSLTWMLLLLKKHGRHGQAENLFESLQRQNSAMHAKGHVSNFIENTDLPSMFNGSKSNRFDPNSSFLVSCQDSTGYSAVARSVTTRLAM